MTVDHAAVARRLHVDQPWRGRAACIGLADVMDPPAEHIKAVRDLGIERLVWEDAKAVCRTCPVYADCRAWVMSLPATEDVTGVCAGLTERQRQRLRASRIAAAAWRRRRAKENA